jgi:hypothetical protein
VHALVAKTVVRDRRGDPLAARAVAARALAGACFEAPGLPPRAELVVRRLHDPVPGALGARARDLAPPAVWQRALSDVLAEHVRRAARPADEAVPATATSVLFADRAELLACFARDIAAGVAATRWWWNALRAGARSEVDVLADALRREPFAVPATFELLARRGDAVAVARTLAPRDAIAIAIAVAAAVGADGAAAAVAAWNGGEGARVARQRNRDSTWAALLQAVPEATEPALRGESRALLLVALASRRTPATLRAPAAAEVLEELIATPLGELPAVSEGVVAGGRPPPLQERRRSRVVAVRGAEAARAIAGARPRRGPAGHAQPGGRLSRGEGSALTRAPAAAAWQRRTRAPDDVDRRRAAAAEPGLLVPSGPVRYEAPSRARDEPATGRARRGTGGRTAVLLDASTVTRLGGIFYLVNVALELGLYGDFSRPRDRATALDPWRLVALVGERLLRGRPRDPVWELLEQLALDERRPRERRVWRLPRGWLAPFADDERPWRVRTDGVRIRVEHPAGFPTLDVPHGELERELSRMRAPALRRARATPGPFSWTDALADYVRARLRATLGDEGDSLLLRRPAEVRVTPATVGVVFSLDEHPVEIRIAGLDRDPGFVPAAGRAVSFHYR